MLGAVMTPPGPDEYALWSAESERQAGKGRLKALHEYCLWEKQKEMQELL
jgi:hypothetical protein